VAKESRHHTGLDECFPGGRESQKRFAGNGHTEVYVKDQPLTTGSPRTRRTVISSRRLSMLLAVAAGVALSGWAVGVAWSGGIRPRSPAAGELLPVPVVSALPAREITLSYRRPGLQLAGTATSLATLPANGNSDPRLELSTGSGLAHNVTPPQIGRECARRCWFEFENAFFLKASVGWVTAWNVVTLQDDVFGTTDGGAHWRLELKTEHSQNAGAQTVVWFNNRSDGWAAALEPTGPGVTAWRTRDGGSTWKQLPQNRTITKSRHVESWYPLPFEFINSTVGYAADAQLNALDLGGGLARTSDGGWIWTQQNVSLPTWARQQHPPAGSYPIYQLPSFSNNEDGMLPVLLPSTHAHAAALALYTTTDQGARWKLNTSLPINTGHIEPPSSSPVTIVPLVSIVNPKTWWVLDPGRSAAASDYTIRVTTHGGRSWTATYSNLPPGSTRLTAVSATQASATVEVYNRQGNSMSELEQTSDAGAHWTRVSSH
jgi:photosystem II stability/assembly factor-like uncharacterized protein